MSKPAVIIYRDHLLPPSETFVRNQAEALESFIPYYVGSRFVGGLPLPEERTIVANKGGWLGMSREVCVRLGILPPGFIQQVRNLNPALIHAHFGPNGVTALPLARALQVPLVVTFHGYDATVKEEYAWRSSYSYWVYFRNKDRLKHEARLFIAVSEFIKGKLLEQGFPPDKIVVHYIGVDTEAFNSDPAVQRVPVVLCVGRLSEKKGCEYLIKAMAQVQAVMPDTELVIIGDGTLRRPLEELAEKLLRRYRFLGVQSPDIVKSWMNRALMLVAPSVTDSTGDSEGLPMVILEAQAMGLPVVSSIHAGIPEAVIQGETGFLANERDWKTLAEYILHLLRDETLWQEFSLKGQERVRTLFSLQKQVGLLEEIYKQVLSDKRSS